MRIKLKYPDVDTFIQKYAVNISRGGVFIATKQPKPVGTYLRFEFVLADAGATAVIRGEGQVQWTKEVDPYHPGKPHGMGIKFTRLDPESQGVIDRALKWRAEHGTSPGVPLPVPTSSAHTIDTGSQSGRLPTREPSQPVALPARAASIPEESTEVRLPPVERESTEVRLPPVEADEAARREGDARTAVEREADPRAAIEPAGDAPDAAGREAAAREAVAREAVAREAAEREAVERDLPEVPRPMPAGGRGETRPIAIEDRPYEPVGRAPNEHTRPITVREPRGRPSDDIDSLAAEWGLSEERLARILKRARPRMVEATAELERLLLKPPKLPTPTKAEALAQLGPLLARTKGKNGTPTH